MDTNRQRVTRLIRVSPTPLDDDQISQELKTSQRQSVNMICRALAEAGLVIRRRGPDGKIVNEWAGPEESDIAPAPELSVLGERADEALVAGGSQAQRDAEGVMLIALSELLSLDLQPTRLTVPSGARVEVDGVDPDRSVLVECLAPGSVEARN